MKKNIITTVGTSLLTNFIDKMVKDNKLNKDFTDAYEYLKTISFYNHNLDSRKVKRVIEQAQILRNVLGDFSNCAEISSIEAIEKELQKTDSDVQITVHLLCTDSILSPLCAEVIAEKIINSQSEQEHRSKIEVRFENLGIVEKISDYQFNSQYIIEELNMKGFSENGLLNLIDSLKSIIENKSIGDYLLNISGGYKALIPPITLLAQLYKLHIFYLYEDSEQIIQLPPMPIGFDWELIEKFTIFLFNENQRKNQKNEFALNEMRDLNLVNKTDFNLTPLGIILREYLKDKESPFTGTIMGYFMEHKLFKYYQEKYGCQNVSHSFKKKDMEGDIDLLIKVDDSVIPIEVKPASVLDNVFNTWTQLKDKFPKRITTLKDCNEVKETWLLLYGESEKNINASTLLELKELLPEVRLKCKFLKIKKNSQSSERHVYQDFFKSDIKDNQITDIEF